MGLCGCPGWGSGSREGPSWGPWAASWPHFAHRILSSTFRKTYTLYHAPVNLSSRKIDARFRVFSLAAEGRVALHSLAVARPKERPFARTEELLEITNVSRRSLYEWVRLGVLPVPRVMSDGNGVYSRWPKIAIDHARFVVEQRELGYALDEIRPMIHARWGSADKVPVEEAVEYEKKVAAARHARHTKKRRKEADE